MRRVLHWIMFCCIGSCFVLFGITVFFDTPDYFRYLMVLPMVITLVTRYSPWGRKVRKLPEEQPGKRPFARLVLCVAGSAVICCFVGYLGLKYVTDWKYRADAENAKELYRAGDYKAAWPYAVNSFNGQDPEVWYIAAINGLAKPAGSVGYQFSEELLTQAAISGFPFAVAVLERHQQNQTASDLTERTKYLLLLETAAKLGDKSAENMLHDILLGGRK